MKTLTYQLDERTILLKAMLKANPEHSKESMEKIIDDCFTNKDFERFTCTVELGNYTMAMKYLNNLTGEKFYRRDKLPITVRTIVDSIFNKVYFRYCN